MKPYTIADVHHNADVMVITMRDGTKAHLGDTTGVLVPPGTPVTLLNEEEHDELFDAALAFQTGKLPFEFLNTPDEDEEES